MIRSLALSAWCAIASGLLRFAGSRIPCLHFAVHPFLNASEIADAQDLSRLLRSRRKRPRRCTAKKRDELAPLHVCPQGSGNGIVGSNENIDRAETRLRHSNMKCWPMSGSGQNRKSSTRAYVFRCSSNNGHHQARRHVEKVLIPDFPLMR